MSDEYPVLVVPKEMLDAPAGPRATHFRVAGTDIFGNPVIEEVFFDPDNPLHRLPLVASEKGYGI